MSKVMVGFCSVALVFTLISCGTIETVERIPAPEEYREIFLARWDQDAFAREYKNQYVKLRVNFEAMSDRGLPTNMRGSGEYVGIVFRAQEHGQEYLNFAHIHKDSADILFELKPWEPIIIYGKMIPSSGTKPLLEAHKIERQQ